MSSLKLVLLGFLRHTIGIIGAFLVARGYIDVEARDSWVATAVQESFGAALMLGAYAWSAIDKRQVIGWIRKALHMDVPLEVSASPKIAAAEEKATAIEITPLIAAGGTK